MSTRYASNSYNRIDANETAKQKTRDEGTSKGPNEKRQYKTYERFQALVSCTLEYERAEIFKVEGMQKNSLSTLLGLVTVSNQHAD